MGYKQLVFDRDSLFLVTGGAGFIGSNLCCLLYTSAFSPSFGSSTLRGYSELELKKYISEMDFLSCREQSGIEIIKKFTDSNVVHTADPTLLLKPSDWNKVSKDICLGRKYILVDVYKRQPSRKRSVCKNMNT